MIFYGKYYVLTKCKFTNIDDWYHDENNSVSNDLYNAVKVLTFHYLNRNEDEDDYCLIYYKDHDTYGNNVNRTKWLGRTIHYVEWEI